MKIRIIKNHEIVVEKTEYEMLKVYKEKLERYKTTLEGKLALISDEKIKLIEEIKHLKRSNAAYKGKLKKGGNNEKSRKTKK